MKVLLCWQLLCFGLSVVNCIGQFEEQAGERDWLKEFIGVPSKLSIHKGSVIYTASSDDGIIARIETKTGLAIWRTFLPESSVITSIKEYNNIIYIISKSNQDRYFSTPLLSALNAVTGSLVWDIALNTTSTRYSSPTDIVIDPSTGALTLLSGNTLYFASSNGEIEWTWASEDNKLHLSSLLKYSETSESATEGTAEGASEWVAVGCTVPDISSSTCGNVALISVSKTTKVGKVHSYKPLTVTPSTLGTTLNRGLHRSSALPTGATVYGSASGETAALSVLRLGSNSVASYPLPLTEGPKLVSVASVGGAPIASVCSPGTCTVHAYSYAKKEIAPILSCTGSSFASTGYSYSDILQPVGVYCASGEPSSLGGTRIALTKAALSTSGEYTVESLDINLPTIQLSNLAHIIGHASTGGVLLTTQSGVVLHATGAGVGWLRDEGLARVQHAVLADRSVIARAEETGVPGVLERWALQADELKVSHAYIHTTLHISHPCSYDMTVGME